MKKLILSAAVFAAFSGSASAQTVAPASDHTFTGNLSLVSDYRFRGISQTFKKPAIQGGFDYSHSSGFYAGNWNSNVSEAFFSGSNLEMDFYGGYKFSPAQDLTLDVGVLHYYYPGSKLNGSTIDNTEIYLGASYKMFSAKYSHGVTNYFNVPNTKNNWYLDLNANLEIAPKTMLNLHAGHQKIKHAAGTPDPSYTDWKVGVAYDAGFATLGLAYIGTDAKSAAYTATSASGVRKDLSDDTVLFSISKTF